jgi:hypothetical protein
MAAPLDRLELVNTLPLPSAAPSSLVGRSNP